MTSAIVNQGKTPSCAKSLRHEISSIAFLTETASECALYSSSPRRYKCLMFLHVLASERKYGTSGVLTQKSSSRTKPARRVLPVASVRQSSSSRCEFVLPASSTILMQIPFF